MSMRSTEHRETAQGDLTDGMAPSAARAIDACPSCGAERMRVFYEVASVPVHSCVLVSSREEALRFPRGDIRLGYCQSCDFISNLNFEAGLLDYSAGYEETQGFSTRFNAFLRNLAVELVERYGIRDKRVLEIGCGKGEFLALMCDLGDNRGIGIDPSYVPGRLGPEAESRAEFIIDFYSEKYSHLYGDVICCRHTLEHIHPTREFLQTIRNSIGGRDPVVFFEVPDVSRVLEELAFWDIYYEHCSYFSLGSLARLFKSSGFDVMNIRKDFDNQYLLLEARPSQTNAESHSSPSSEEDWPRIGSAVELFQRDYPRKIEQLKGNLERSRSLNQRVVLWGSGSKAVAYLNTLNVRDEIVVVVDINPYKHGKYLAGTGQEIVGPDFLSDYLPDTVIIVNPVYRDEIQGKLQSMGLDPELVML